MGATRKVLSMVVLGVAGTLLAGCAGPVRGKGDTSRPVGWARGVIAVVPFFGTRPETGGGRLVRCPRCEEYVVAGEILQEAPGIVTSIFRQRLTALGHNLVSKEGVEKAFPVWRDLEEQPELLARQLALEVGADTVLVGWILRYEDRVGSAWGVQRPASVAFAAFLFNGREGRLLWRGQFDETQKPLSENVLEFFSFVRRGGRWLTAAQLASDGVSRVLLTFPRGEGITVNR
jgi:hypothetical protein